MNDESEGEQKRARVKRYDWREDLSKSRNLHAREQEAFGYVLGWLEDWRQKRSLPAGRDAARRWWKEVAQAKQRPEWQLNQWAEAIRWFLGWLEICEKAGGDARGLCERLSDAVERTGARQGLRAWIYREGAKVAEGRKGR